ncbi:MAG: riboflavin biosynthesis protein RibD [Hamadaea sp.]|uniref:dihydrofolate reductase family protein n=1 Tax=Hamadaea sp. TaxID=2024425 RepID=UPI00181344D2|nr:dihydrofolate reductase family protein [Hamadaea sp.]NUR70430.1 riboflavin biosynthesis protein RibD [Hamadaea sp.]NUT20020.1 riboflavin biosynthesis protein RibD [Hamadaea sp.]
MTERTGRRRVVANLAITMDGYYQGPGGRGDLAAMRDYVPFAEAGYEQIATTIQTATTAVLGRVNAEGFLSYWPTTIDDETVDPRDRAYARWLVGAEKVVLSSSLKESPWEGVRIVDAPAPDVIAELKTTGEGDIFVNHSASVIKALLAADAIDRLNLVIAPVISGDGSRLFVEGLPGSRWTLQHHFAGDPAGTLALTYDRQRDLS